MNHTDGATGAPIHALADEWSASRPDAVALTDAGTTLTYGELREAAEAAAARLRELGVRAGDRVLIVGENCVAACVFVLALSRLDAWSCIVNARLSPREIDGFVAHATPRRVLYTTQVSDAAAGHAARHGAEPMTWPSLGEVATGPLAADALAEPVPQDPARRVAALIYTSGTSGAPKGVMLSHASLRFAATTARELRGFRPGDRIYGALPMAHVVGLANQFLGAMASGAALVLVPRFDPAQMARALAEDGITGFTGVPAMFAKLVAWSRENGVPLAAPALRYTGTAGAPLTPSLKAATEAAFGTILHNGYGMTEMSPTIAQTRMTAPRTDCSVGHPIPGVQARIVDPAGQPVPPGTVGELWVRGPNLMLGYYRNEALTREVIDADGWLNTGDMARQDADGALHIAGRTKELIIRSGFNVYPVEVEQVINAHPEVVQSAVVGRTVPDNEEVVAFVERTAGSALDDAALRAYLRERLSPYKVPGEIRFVEQLPAAPSGKILKSALKDAAASPAA